MNNFSTSQLYTRLDICEIHDANVIILAVSIIFIPFIRLHKQLYMFFPLTS